MSFIRVSSSPTFSSVQFSCSVVSDSLQPCGPQFARLLCPWNSPGKDTRVGCHSLLQRISMISLKPLVLLLLQLTVALPVLLLSCEIIKPDSYLEIKSMVLSYIKK